MHQFQRCLISYFELKESLNWSQSRNGNSWHWSHWLSDWSKKDVCERCSEPFLVNDRLLHRFWLDRNESLHLNAVWNQCFSNSFQCMMTIISWPDYYLTFTLKRRGTGYRVQLLKEIHTMVGIFLCPCVGLILLHITNNNWLETSGYLGLFFVLWF